MGRGDRYGVNWKGCLRRLGGLAHGFGDVAYNLVHEALVVALGHHADDGFGAGGANDEPATQSQTLLAQINGLLDQILLQRRAIAR